MAWFIECPFCHKSVFRWFYAWHESGHTQRRADGQMTEHVTLAPQKRFEGSLNGVPQAYRHAKCGVVTGMPEEIIRTYLVNPLTYNDSTFCCGCGDYIISSELRWVETNESVMSYTARLRCEYLKTEFGIDAAGADIVVTPRAMRALDGIAAEQALQEPYFVTLAYTLAGANVNYGLGVAQNWDTSTEEVVHAVGRDVVVKKGAMRKLSGTVIDFTEHGPGGFVIARLRPWA